MKNINWKFIFDKMGTIIVDRRFWVKLVIPTFLALGVFPFLVEANADAMSDQAVALSKLIVAIVFPTVSAWLLSSDWTKRAPSGLGFKDIPSADVDEFVAGIVSAIEKIK